MKDRSDYNKVNVKYVDLYFIFGTFIKSLIQKLNYYETNVCNKQNNGLYSA